MIDDKNKKMKKWAQYFSSHYLFWRLSILPVFYNKCIPQVNRTQNRLKAILSKNMFQQSMVKTSYSHGHSVQNIRAVLP